ncbi:MAG: hypothetical protein ACE5GX_07080 [Thermoanaerobaculia bacterium]
MELESRLASNAIINRSREPLEIQCRVGGPSTLIENEDRVVAREGDERRAGCAGDEGQSKAVVADNLGRACVGLQLVATGNL